MANKTSNQSVVIEPVKIGHGVTFWGTTPKGSEVYTRSDLKDGLNQTICYLQRGNRRKDYTLRRDECPFGSAQAFVKGIKKDLLLS